MLVTCAVTRRAFLARTSDLRTYRLDLDDALVESETSVLGAAPDLLIPKQPWASALVARALSDVDMDRPGALAAAQLLASSRRPGTLRSYEGKFDRFFLFCTDVQIGQGFPALSPMPATSSSVLLYLGWLQQEDKVHARSLQPYMSAINQAHIDFGFPPPAVGQLVRLARRGFGEVEGESSASVRRIPLPAAVVMQILQLGLVTPSVPVLGACTCLVVQFLWFARYLYSFAARSRRHRCLRYHALGAYENDCTTYGGPHDPPLSTCLGSRRARPAAPPPLASSAWYGLRRRILLGSAGGSFFRGVDFCAH